MTKRIYKIQGMDCDACAKMIELDLEDAGIKSSCNYATQKLELELDDKEKEDKVRQIVEKGGYKLVSD
jgi:copper chaperone CopZ